MGQTARPREPELFNYEQLVTLYKQETPPEPLRQRLNHLLTTPFVNNEASAGGVRPVLPETANLGKVLRVTQWNIEKGLEYAALARALTDPIGFSELLDSEKYPQGSKNLELIMEQVRQLTESDVIVLNEVDWGMKRTGYRNVVADLAAALKMNFAYGVQFVEVDPIDLGIESFEGLPVEDQSKLVKEIRVDTDRYKGLHGTAILSRFPLENVRLRPFRHQAYDWYSQELKSVHPLEQGKRKAAQLVFQQIVRREVRRGGRMMLLAEIADPGIPGGRATIVATHLEDRTKPEGRRKQLEELLFQIKDISGPVILAGDMNTSTQDNTPTSLAREVKKRLGSKSFWLMQGIKFLAGLKLSDLVLGGVNVYRKQADPTVRSIPLVAPNPEARFFEELKKFRFADGSAFDFRGGPGRSVDGNAGSLSNSNQRGRKGFITTYEMTRTIYFVGKFKLDWIFVKPPGLTEPDAKQQSHRFAPHFGRTLKSLNDGFFDGISDHDPIMIDLPLEEPPSPLTHHTNPTQKAHSRQPGGREIE